MGYLRVDCTWACFSFDKEPPEGDKESFELFLCLRFYIARVVLLCSLDKPKLSMGLRKRQQLLLLRALEGAVDAPCARLPAPLRWVGNAVVIRHSPVRVFAI
jgi:hypothetical protein